MPTDLSVTSRFSKVDFSWSSSGRFVREITFQTTTDATRTRIEVDDPRDYEDVAEDSNLAILRDNYRENVGLLDADGNKRNLIAYNFNLAADDPPIEDLTFYNSFNPLVAAEFEGWLQNLEAQGAFIREGEYSRDGDTLRPIIKTPFDDIPLHRNPGSDTYEFLLEKWTVMQFGPSINFERNWSADARVTADNINDDFDVLAFIDWWDDLRISGDELPNDIKEIETFQDRTFRLVQGTGFDTLDLEVSSRGHDIRPDGTYEHVGVSFRRISTETGTIDIGAIRAVLAEATGTLDTSDEDMTPEVPVRGGIDTPIYASEIIFPDGLKIRPRSNRITLTTPDRGALPIDGASVRAVRFAALDDGVTNGKYMPNDGSAVVHFGHDETADGIIRYRNIEDMVLADGSDVVQRVHNISDTYNCTVQDDDGGTLLVLKPYQQSGPLQASLEVGGEAGEILAINPPDRHVLLRRGASGTVFSQGVSYPESSDSDADNYHSLNLPSSALVFQDSDGITVNTGPNPPAAVISTINRSLWAIRGSYDIEWPGWVTFRVRYRLTIVGPPPTGELAIGNGIAFWIAEGSTGLLTRHHFTGAEAMGGTGGKGEYHLIHRGKHAKDTRFLLMHRIPNGSDIAVADYDHIHMEALEGAITLEPEIRKVITP